MNVNQLLAELERRHPGEGEYLQAVREVLLSVETVYNRHPEFEKLRIAERIVKSRTGSSRSRSRGSTTGETFRSTSATASNSTTRSGRTREA